MASAKKSDIISDAMDLNIPLLENTGGGNVPNDVAMTGKLPDSIMRDKIGKLKSKLSNIPSNWSMQKTVDGR